MAIINQHIHKFLNYYIEEIDKPEYAVLLSGKWGSGKTHFIKKFKNDQTKISIVQISLFGLKSKEDIHRRIVLKQLTFPKMSEVIGKGLSAAFAKISDINLSLSDVSIELAIKQVGKKKTVFVFDDLERIETSFSEVFGYINQLVEEYGQKVIFIADDTKLKGRVDYLQFKEKIIGKTFEIEQDFEAAFLTFTDKLENAKEILNTNQSSIRSVFDRAGYNNLRSLRQGILDFDRLINHFEQKFKDHSALMAEFIQIFFALLFEIKSNSLDITTLTNLSELRIGRMLLEEKNDYIETEIEKVYRKYDFINFDYLLFPNTLWIELFSKNFITSQQITESLNKSRYFFREEREPWINLWHYLDLEEEEFQTALNTVLEKLQKNEYLEPEKCMHITGILLRLQERLLYTPTREQIVVDMKSYIERNTKNWIDLDIVDEYRLDTAPYGLGYMSEETPEFHEIKTYLLRKAKEAIYEKLSDYGDKLLSSLKANDYVTFVELLSVNRQTILYRLPVFQSISPDEFFETLINVENKYFRDVSKIIIKRYEMVYFEEYTPLLDELDFWKKLYEIVKTHIQSNQANIKNVWFGHFSDSTEKHIIQKIEKRLQ